jgi:LCP family protein required for cell wall assembly
MVADPNQRPKKKKRMKLWKKILIGVLIVVAGVLITAGTLTYIEAQHLLNQVQYVSDDPNPTIINEESSVVYLKDVVTETTLEPLPTYDYIHNILLIGIDSRSSGYSEDGSGDLADVIMILTINEKDNTLKLTSVQRDSLAYIPGHTKPQKINSAMSLGGPQLLRLVLEMHLRIDLMDYAYVNFRHMEKIIDSVGGVVVHLTESERTNPEGGLNELIAEQNVIFGSDVDANKVYETGDICLNGRQAVAYARIRHVGNGDYERSQRQVEVLQGLLNSFMNLGLTGKTDVMAQVLSQVSTNMLKSDIEKYALNILPNITSTKIEYLQVPIEGYSNEGMYYDLRTGGEWSIRPNWNGMIPLIQDYIFGARSDFDPVPQIPEAPVATPTPKPTETAAP